MIKSLASLLALILAMGGTAMATSGCDALGIGKDTKADEDDGKKKKKKKKDDDDEDEEEEEKEEEKTAEETEEKSDEKPEEDETIPTSDENAVKDCPGQQKISGTRKVLRPLSVYEATDTTSKRLTGLAPGTLVNLKFQCGNWIMVDYPSGVGQMSPGWVNVAIKSADWKVEDDKPEPPKVDAGTDVKDEKDAGVEPPPDSGTEQPPPDGGRKIRIPKLQKKE